MTLAIAALIASHVAVFVWAHGRGSRAADRAHADMAAAVQLDELAQRRIARAKALHPATASNVVPFRTPTGTFDTPDRAS